jgi:methyl-accepting chemotaxis protein
MGLSQLQAATRSDPRRARPPIDMNFLHNLRLGTRLGIGFAAVLALLVLSIATAVLGFNRVDQAAEKNVSVDLAKSDAVATLNVATRDNARRTMELFFAADAAHAGRVQAAIEDNKKKVAGALETLERLAYTARGKELIQDIKTARMAYVASFTKVNQLMAEGQREEASRLLMSETLPAMDALQSQVVVLADLQRQLAQTTAQGVQDDVSHARMAMVVLGLVGLVVGVGFAWWLTRSITTPLHEAVQIAQNVAAGDLRSKISIQRHDEMGEPLEALQQMNRSLARIVGEVRHGSDSIATGSQQIASGNADLSQRTEEQASNLQQTAASMEQLTSTVKHNAETATQANQLVGSASEAAAEGGAVMSRMVQTMQEISGSSHRIAEIIGTIDGIAFQTNILALNAAVEAARAGEAGRGFAVVASEVRSLAQRSAEAAKEIRTLISHSVQQVEAGSSLVGDAGRSMDNIVAQVRRVRDMINEISAAGVEQSQGISQVGDAVAQLDQVTQQNAALVEQSAAAAESLKHQAGRLAQMVGTFKLNASDEAAAMAPSHALASFEPAPAFSAPVAPVVHKPAPTARKPAARKAAPASAPATARAASTAPSAPAARPAPVRSAQAESDHEGWVAF